MIGRFKCRREEEWVREGVGRQEGGENEMVGKSRGEVGGRGEFFSFHCLHF